MQHMQRPTCTNIRIRSTQDAHKIFYAVQQGILAMVTRRLDADERLALRSGCIYAWEERGPHTEITGLGIERFTEGRRWSPSRVRDEFLFYYEKYTPSTDGNQRMNDNKLPPRDWDPLVKQTYSVYVDTTKGRRKWHLTAYFTQATVDQLGTVDDIDSVGNLDVPSGLFKSTRVSKNKKNEEAPSRVGESSTPSTSTVTRTPPGSQPLQMYQPYPNSNYPSNYYSSAEYSPPPNLRHRTPLPPIGSGGPYASSDTSPRLRPPPLSQQYSENRSVSLSARAWTPAPRGGESPYYPNTAPSPAPYSPSGSYRPHHHHSHISQPQSGLFVSEPSRLSAEPSHSPTWPDEGVHRNHVAEINRGGLRTPLSSNPLPSRSYQTPYDTFAPPNTDNSIGRSRFPHDSPNTTSSLASALSPPSIPPIILPEAESPYEPPSPTSSMESDDRRGGLCRRVDLAPLHALQRSHPYRRDPVDDRTLRLLGPRSS